MSQTVNPHTVQQARDVKRRALGVFGALADVAGIGITRVDEGYGLKINLRSAPEAGVTLPADIDGVPVVIEIVGTVTKQ